MWNTWAIHVVTSRDMESCDPDFAHVTVSRVGDSFVFTLLILFGLLGGLFKACLTKLILSDCLTVNWPVVISVGDQTRKNNAQLVI